MTMVGTPLRRSTSYWNAVVDRGNSSALEPYALRVLGDSMEPEFADASTTADARPQR